MREYNVHEVLSILQKYYITDSQQMVTRWIREGKINGVRSKNKKEGYRILEEDLFDFIEEQRPGLPSIFEVYEEYIKNLNPNNNELNEHPVDKEEKGYIDTEEKNETGVSHLKEKLKKLESTITDVHKEKQVMEMQLIEIMDQNKFLIEDNKTFSELLEILDEENKQLKESSIKITSSKDTNDMHRKRSLVTFDDFVQLSSEVINNLEYDEKEIEKHLDLIYKQIYDEDGLVKGELMLNGGEVKCPYTDKIYKQQKRLVKHAITYYFENLIQTDNPKQFEISMAND
ncbi:helix-turn-helix domain-containing protein [Peribacillus frigoritolerans]|uniref:helix-turn-helix domain-containing protein n=1 Tax=Peribacillus frigoritolerans TaxID=450367 RepID=UPI00207A3A2F|nr:helix-turn-helix domain-containing protein [Peribacillus frigoritolerans]USK75895.1 helix-turn-helix domain-containing protein [Peribacillus frigoritolerans]